MAQRRQHQPILRLEPGSTDLPAKHRHLMAQHQQLDILHRLTTAAEHNQPEYSTHNRVGDRQQHRNDHAAPTVGRSEVTEPHKIAHPSGTPIATIQISNDSAGYADLLAWICQHTPGPRLVVSMEGTRSYGVGLARAVAAAGMTVIECEQPNRKQRRGKGKSDRSMRTSPC